MYFYVTLSLCGLIEEYSSSLLPDCKVLFLRGEQKISSNFLRGSGTETSVTKPVQTDT